MRRSVGILLVCLGAASPSAAAADGLMSMRGGYFKERSTLVQQPMIDAELEAGAGARLDAHVLVDGITSASSATGSASAFTERRYEVGLGYVRELGPGRAGAAAHYSMERDYISAVLGVHGELDLAQKNATARLDLGAARDNVSNGVAVDQGGLGTPRRTESLVRWNGAVSFTQIL